jgi:uncharacterized membrane protein
MSDIIFYLHLWAAASWIGGSMLLFVLGITLRDKEAQKKVYYYIGPLYGYFESVVLVVLLATGTYMLYDKGLLEVLESGSEFATIVSSKLILVGLITFATVVHMYISLKAHGRERSQKEKIISRATSMMIFFLNLVILWFAIQLRNFL